MKKFIFSIMPVLVMCLSLLPMTAFAEEAKYRLYWREGSRSNPNCPVTVTWEANSHKVNVRYDNSGDYFILEDFDVEQETELYKQNESSGSWSLVSGVSTRILNAGDVRSGKNYGSVLIGFFDASGTPYAFTDGVYGIDFRIGANGFHSTPSGGERFIINVSDSGITHMPLAKGEYNGHRYEVYDVNLTWKEAKEFCESIGGYLATVSSDDENSYILNLTRQGSMQNYWIGGYKAQDNWFWVNGESFSYSNWAPGEPNNQGSSGNSEAYTHIDGNKSRKWNDIGNNAEGYGLKSFGLVCEYGEAFSPAPTPTPTPPPSNGTEIGGFKGESISSGAKLWWNPVRGGVGYRVFRSTNSSQEGVSATDFYITSNEFVDVNVDANKTYYYTVKQVIKEARPLEGLKEELGPVTSKVTVKTGSSILGGNASDSSSPKQFILMTLDDPYMSVNGVREEIDPGRGTTPLILNSRTMVPIRAIVEAMGGTVGWNDSARKITLNYKNRAVIMTLNSKNITVDGSSKDIDVAPTSINSRTMVPIRFAAENLGCAVDWLNSTKQIVIVY